MSSVHIALFLLCSTFGGAMLGIWLQARLPDRHFESDSRDVVKLVMGLISTMAALALGLLISTAKTAYDTQENEIQQLAVNVIQLDQALDHYGEEAGTARVLLRAMIAGGVERIWPTGQLRPKDLWATQAQEQIGQFHKALISLSPHTPAQRLALERALAISESMRQTRTMMFLQLDSAISVPFMGLLVFWLTLLFVGYGCLARVNATLVVTMLVGSLAVSGAVFIIFELNNPYAGLIRVSDLPMRFALDQINK